MDLASRYSGLELLILNGEFKARSLAQRLFFNLRVEGTLGVLELHCKLGEGGVSSKTLRN